MHAYLPFRKNTGCLSPNSVLLFPEKEAKSVCSASQKIMGYPILPRSGTTGFWGLAPNKLIFLKSIGLVVFFFFQKKKQKAFVLLRRR
jgi:hypothetical protein